MVWHNFQNDTGDNTKIIDADEVNENFDYIEGSISPMSNGVYVDDFYNLGTTSAHFLNGYITNLPSVTSARITNATITNANITNATITNATIDNLTVNEEVPSLEISNLVISGGGSLTVHGEFNNAAQSRVRGYLSTTQTITSGVTNGAQLIHFNTKDYDNASEYTITTYTFTAANEGYYHCYAQIGVFKISGTNNEAALAIYRNGSICSEFVPHQVSGGWATVSAEQLQIQDTLYLAAGNTLNFYAFYNDDIDGTMEITTAYPVVGGRASYFSIYRIG